MLAKIIYIFTIIYTSVYTKYTEADQAPKLERTNVVNKGIWIRNKYKENLFDKTRVADFIFRENSLDVDNLLQNNFDTFGTNSMQESPLVSSYVKRTKRATRFVRDLRPRKSILKNCNGKSCKSKIINIENKSTLSSDPAKPSKAAMKDHGGTSVFNEYPFEVAILLNNNKTLLHVPPNDTIPENLGVLNNQNISNVNNTDRNREVLSFDNDFKDNNDTVGKNTTSPKRSMKYDFETEVIKKFEFTEDLNKTDEVHENNDNKVNDRNIFDKDNTVWHQNAPIPDVNVYKVVPKEPQKSKPVTERGLIKVISMLTKTFKKIMKQHNDIKDIHNRISEINEDFVKNAASLTNKFQDFDLKYLYLLKFHEKLKSFDAKLTSRQEYFKAKEREMARNFKEFENQQKKFLQQQRQFYNIQKLMLAQNEKINLKQNLIAKTQSEISHRQNNFARILKKAKQMYVESKNLGTTKLSSSVTKTTNNNYINPKSESSVVQASSPVSATTESVKINLFSIPTSNKIENQDDMIIKEKDEQTIDDLVYKYYFNNTFIDNLMKNNVLTSFIGNAENSGHSRNVKTKRNELKTTILLPVFDPNDSEANIDGAKNRERRWINHHSRHKHNKKKDHSKYGKAAVVNGTGENYHKSLNKPVQQNTEAPHDKPVEDNILASGPFMTMATNFCKEIGQNLNQQMLRWCVEKALRRLQFLDINAVTNQSKSDTAKTKTPSGSRLGTKSTERPTAETPDTMIMGANSSSNSSAGSTLAPSTNSSKIGNASRANITSSVKASPTNATAIPPRLVSSNKKKFFPDNEQLESNLRQFVLPAPDIEGNVYYEGSVHASQILASDSTDIDDIIPGLESNSRVDMDPRAFDIQAKRRAFVRQLNEKIRQSLGIKT